MFYHPIVVANWKMQGTLESSEEILNTLVTYTQRKKHSLSVDIVICPPFTLLEHVSALMEGHRLHLGAQNCFPAPPGAYTGEIGPDLLKEMGCEYVILGHSERRRLLGETNAVIAKKVSYAHKEGLKVIACVGETREERKLGQMYQVLEAQITEGLGDTCNPDNTFVAYEPVWAIGSGETPTLQEIAETHAMIRSILSIHLGQRGASMHLLYGGSVNEKNAKNILAEPLVMGVLVGGASLSTSKLISIISDAQEFSGVLGENNEGIEV